MDSLNAILKFHGVEEITKENVNNTFNSSGRRIIDYAVIYEDLYESYIPWLLLLGATVNATTLYSTHQNHVKFVLEAGLDVTTVSIERAAVHFHEYNLYLLINWGVKLPSKFIHFPYNAPGPVALKEYASLSNARVQECRKALLALLRICNQSVFRPLRDGMIQMATQVWRFKGGEGVGPRSHKWG